MSLHTSSTPPRVHLLVSPAFGLSGKLTASIRPGLTVIRSECRLGNRQPCCAVDTLSNHANRNCHSLHITEVDIGISPPARYSAPQKTPESLLPWIKVVQSVSTEIGPVDLHWPDNAERCTACCPEDGKVSAGSHPVVTA